MKDRKKILFVCNSTWGIYKFRINLIRRLITEGLEVYVVAPEDRYTEHLMHENNLHYIPLKKLKATSFSLINDWRLYHELKSCYTRLKPDLIFHYTIKPNIYGSLAAKSAGCASVSVVTGLGYTFLNNGALRKLVSGMYRFAFAAVKEVWFLNKDDQKTFIDRRILKQSKAFLLPGEGVDVGGFRSSLNYTIKPRLHFLLLGRIIKEKGISEYVAAAAELKAKGYQAEFLIAGYYDHDNPASIPHKQFFDWIRSGTIRYLGASDDVRPFLEQADCIVLPSYSEGLPLTLLEGGCMSRPLIATDVAGCREVVEQGVNGLLCKPRDAASLARAMSAFYHLSPAERIAMGAAARTTVTARFDQQLVHSIYLSKISSMLGIHLGASNRRNQLKNKS